jgi:integrase
VEKLLKNGTLNPFSGPKENEKLSIAELFKLIDNYALKNYKESTYKDFKSRIGQFKNWVLERGFTSIEEINRKEVSKYLNTIELKSSKRNRNNTRAALQSAFDILEKNYIIERNFIDDIEVLKATPKRHKTYSLKQESDIFNRLDEVDPELGLFIKFVSINMLRPIEVCRIQVKSINIEEKKLQFEAKNKHFKIKIIPDILFRELPDLSGYSKNCYLFTPEGIAESETTENNRRDYWSKRFKRVVKKHFNLGTDYTMYSFRHTFITKLYNEFAKQMTPFEAKSKLMLITGHTTMTALEKYLRDIDAVLPDDYSKYLK